MQNVNFYARKSAVFGYFYVYLFNVICKNVSWV